MSLAVVRAGDGPAERPGDRLLHPVALVASALYLGNDWWLKAAHPGFVSGKLSDVAGMIVLPLTLYALLELGSGRLLGRRVLACCIAVTVVGFGAVELWAPAEALWCWTWGAMQWPFRAAASALAGGPVPPVRPVVTWSDPTDLWTVPFGAAAWLARRR